MKIRRLNRIGLAGWWVIPFFLLARPTVTPALVVPMYSNYDLIVPVSPKKEYRRYSLLIVQPEPLEGLVAYPSATDEQTDESMERFNRLRRLDPGLAKQVLELERRELWRGRGDPRTGQVTPEFRLNAIRTKVEESYRLLEIAHDFATETYLRSGRFGKTLPEGIRRDVAGVLTGHQPLVMITRYRNPRQVLQTISLAFEGEDGMLPLERRLKGRPFLPRAQGYRLDVGRRSFVYPRSPGCNFPLADDLISSVPVLEAVPAEIKLYSRALGERIPWGPLVRRVLIAHWLTRKSPYPFPAHVRYDLESFGLAEKYLRHRERAEKENDFMQVAALHRAFFDLQIYQLPRQSTWIDTLYLEAVGDVPARAYRSYFDFDEEWPETIEDPDVKGERARILFTRRSRFEARSMAPGRWYPENYPISQAHLIRSNYPSPFHETETCAEVLTKRENDHDLMESHLYVPMPWERD